MNYFLNYDVNNGFSYTTYVNPNAIMCATNDISDFVNDVLKDINTAVCIDNEQEVIDALCEGHCFSRWNVPTQTLKEIYDLIKGY